MLSFEGIHIEILPIRNTCILHVFILHALKLIQIWQTWYQSISYKLLYLMPSILVW